MDYSRGPSSPNVHLLGPRGSAEFGPKAIGDDAILQVIVLSFVDYLLGTRPGALVTVLLPALLYPPTDSPSNSARWSNVRHRRMPRNPITKITRTAVAERNPEVRNT